MNISNNISNVENASGTITSGDHLSCWFASEIDPLVFETLGQDIDIDVLVIGGGIAGLTTAYCLSKQGLRVALAEDGYLASGETGRTSGHLSAALNDRYTEIEKVFDQPTASLAAQSHTAAIEWMANTIQEHHIDCHFKYVDGYLFLHESESAETLTKEFEATQRAGLPTKMVFGIPAIEEEYDTWCIRFPHQAQFHVLKYMKGLAEAFIQSGGKIYTQTRAENICKEGATANGFTIKTKHIVVATNTPVNDWVTMHTKQWPYRTYVIAGKIAKGKLPYALWWDTGDKDSKWISKPYHYVRLEEYDDQFDLLICGGEDHRTGQTDEEDKTEKDRYELLEAWARKHFPEMEAVEYTWSGQVMISIDSLGFIGKNPGDENIYIITGDSGNGLTNGTLGGMIISDIILGNDNPWIDIYSPSRISLNTKGNYLSQVGNMIAQYADWVTPEILKHTDDLKPGEGGVISSGLQKVAVYRDEDNVLHTCTAVCPHMGAILQWNADEKSFDCPMHGSRFTSYGNVINGPAAMDLEKIIIKAKQTVG
jgi:glycine/D-amino acid oxidase-like deaminating enzyme/nitrite reductase/ring-hydroxylating ferredoxin subunit